MEDHPTYQPTDLPMTHQLGLKIDELCRCLTKGYDTQGLLNMFEGGYIIMCIYIDESPKTESPLIDV